MPDDLSPLQNLTNLNLQNIFFSDFEKSVLSIATLPNLRSLYINLQTEDQVDLIMRHLPNLEYLNSLPVDREALEEETPSMSNDPGQVQERPGEEDS